jgi:hypothetical protein
VDITQAIQVVGSQVHIRGRSDEHLIDMIQHRPGFVVPKKRLLPAAGLRTGVNLRPMDALHALSYATRPRYQDDVLDMYVKWGLLRYLGFFDLAHGGMLPGLKLSEAGQRISGNQRRVTSEEVGIGFGVLLATRWFEQTAAGGIPITAVDVDAALDDRFVLAAGTRKAVGQIGARRPDYLIIAHDPDARSRYRVRVLECKGTSNPRYAVSQLTSAVGQLSDITVGGRIPAGLAVSTISASSEVSYLALDPDEGDEASYEVNSNTIAQVADFQLRDRDIENVSPVQLTNATVRSSWATLADFGGNLEALDRWAPRVMRRRLYRQPRDRVTFGTPYGDARGTSVTFSFEGRQLTVRYAINVTVDQQLTQNAESIIEAQSAFAETLARSPEAPHGATDGQDYSNLHSATSDGSIFTLMLN